MKHVSFGVYYSIVTRQVFKYNLSNLLNTGSVKHLCDNLLNGEGMQRTLKCSLIKNAGILPK